MTKAAGVLFLTKANTALFLKRGAGGDMPGAWCFPGGRLEGDETAAQGAIRESLEESGRAPAEGDLTLLARSISEIDGVEVDFTTYVCRISEEFTPTLCAEHTGYAWSAVETPPEPLHPGCRIALDRLSMDELGIARAMAAGQLTSPQRYENIWLFAIRITGTGRAYRQSIDEHVWRDSSIYLNEEFLARCNGLPVIMQHPQRATLNSEEFADRVIGTVFIPYIQGEDVWAIVKIYDAASAEMMSVRNPAGETLSTSPAVVFRDPSVNSKYKQEDGSTVLIEGKPSLLDHIAVCGQGVWDKGGPPTGISVHDETGATKAMAEESEGEKKAREDAARKDAEEKADRAKADAERDARWDSRFDACMGAVADMGKRFDAFMDSMRGDASKRRADESEEEHADRMDAMRRPDESEKEYTDRMDAKKADAARKDADEVAAKKKADEEEEAKKDAARKDAARQDALDRRVSDVERVVATRPADERRALSEAQARAERAYAAFADSAPAPMAGEDLNSYRRRLARKHQAHSKRWEKIDLDTADDAVLTLAEADIYADAVRASTDVSVIGAGKLVGFTESVNGHQITTYHGSTGGWMGRLKGAASQYVTDINLDRKH